MSKSNPKKSKLSMRVWLAIFVVLCLLCGCNQKQNDAGDIDAARVAYANGNFTEAERIYESYLQYNADGSYRWEAWNRLLDISLNVLGNYDKSTSLLEAMSLEFSHDPEQSWKLSVKLAQLQEDAKQWNEAIGTWQSALEIDGLDDSHYPEVYLHMARIYRRQHAIDLAEEALKACEADASLPDTRALCLYELAQTLEYMQRRIEAQSIALTPAQVRAFDPKTNQERIKELLLKIMNLEGVESERKALAGFMLAEVYENMNMVPKAIELLQSIRDIYPNPKVVDVRLDYLKKKTKKKSVHMGNPDQARISQ